jgi:hypothetical protein
LRWALRFIVRRWLLLGGFWSAMSVGRPLPNGARLRVDGWYPTGETQQSYLIYLRIEIR